MMPTNPKTLAALDMRESVLAKNTVLNFIGMVLPKIIALLAIPFTIRLLGTDRFGILSLVFIVFGYFSFLDLGLSQATTRFIAKALGKQDFEAIPNILWTTVTIQFLLGLLGTVALVLSAPFIVERVILIPAGLIEESKAALFLLAFSIPPVLITASFRGALEASQRFDLVNLIKVPSSILSYLVPLVIAALGFGLPAIILLLLVVRLLTLSAYIVCCIRIYPNLRFRIALHKDAAKPILTYGLWVQVSNILSPSLAYLDRFMLGALVSVEAVGFYTLPSEAIMSLAIIPNSLLMALFPIFSALDGSQDETKAKRFFGLSVKFLLITSGLVAVVMIFFAHGILTLWLGSAFAQKCTMIFQIMIVLFFLNALANVPFSYLQGIGRSDIVAKFYIFELLFALPLAWWMVRTWGILGAALTWTIQVAVDTTLLFVASIKLGKIEASELIGGGTVRAIAILGILSAACFGLIRFSWGGPVFVALVLVSLAALWFTVLDTREKSWILGSMRTLRTRLSR